ncbi:MAG: (5-formylfuran-3-yl)methyl phosphate synthase [Planctomyces sp.]
MQPRLLVSVRNASEAISAWRGGADIIDLKEPQNGPLGAVSFAVPNDVLQSLRRLPSSPRVLLSVALGEAREWLSPFTETSDQGLLLDALRQMVSELQFLKMGLSTDVVSEPPRPRDILQQWANVRDLIDSSIQQVSRRSDESAGVSLGDPELKHTGMAGPGWVAVAYADADRSGAPSVTEVVDAAITSGCRGLLIDTFLKDGRGLFAWCSLAELTEIRNRTREAGLFLALAGQINAAAMDQLKVIQPDVIAVRGSVCRAGTRSLEIEEEAVRGLKRQISSTF